MLLENDVNEHLALAYVYAVASRAGCSTELIRVDRNSVDVTLKHVDRENVFDGQSLLRLMALTRRREVLR